MKVTSRERKFILVGSLVVIAVLAVYAITKLIPDGDDISMQVELKKKMLMRYRETLNGESTYKTRIEQYRRQLEQQMNRLLPGSNSNLAAAELQRIVKEFADQSGVEITQRNPRPEEKVQNMESIVKVSVRIETSCTPDKLVQFLTAIQNYEKLLVIDEFLISSYRVSRRYEIRPNMTISGFVSVPEPPKTMVESEARRTNLEVSRKFGRGAAVAGRRGA